MKNKKGQVASIGAFVLLFVGLIVSLSLIQPSAQNLNDVVNTAVVVNASVTFPTNTTALVLTGQSTSGWVIVNATDASKTVPATNYTVSNNVVSSTGTLQSTIIAVANSAYQGKAVNISYTYQPYGYATDGGTRTVTNLIIALAALAILAFVLYYVLKEGADLF